MKILHADCQEALMGIDTSKAILVTDPPFNIGYHYASYADNMSPATYFAMLARIVNKFPRGGNCAIS
jgi:DNA modification methylase